MNTMADGARDRLVAQIGEALFGQPGLTLMELAEKVKGMHFPPDGQSAALHAAVSAIYFDDSRDYLSALWTVVCALNPAVGKLLEHDPAAAYEATRPGQTALSAQPSPAGQDATIKDAYIRHFGWECGWLGDVGFGFIEGYRAALAARQPVGQEPVGEVYQGSSRVPQARLSKPLPIGSLLYAAPPAQAVDLAQFREAVEMAMETPLNSIQRERLVRLLALIDSKAVGNG